MTSLDKRKSVVVTSADRKKGAAGLRFDARLAYLDDRTARARKLNRKADLLDLELKHVT